MTVDARDLEKMLTARSARVGVIGMGYVGLPIALTMVRAGFEVHGFDTDPASIQRLLGHSHLDTTMSYTHVINRGAMGVISPFDVGQPGECGASRGRPHKNK